MNTIQIIKTASGEELVVIPRQDYEALLAIAADAEEDEADIAIYDSRKAALQDESDLLPAQVSEQIIRGATRLKAIRMWRGLAQGELASASGLSQGYVSDLERGRKPGSAETLAALARLLDVPEKWLA